jgi:two-component system response regulator NreC
MEVIKVLVCDDHEVVRAGIRLILERQGDFEIIGEATDGEEAIAQVRKLRPGIVIMDLSLPGLGGLDAIPQVLQAVPGVRVLVLTIHDDEAYFFRALKVGAAGYLLKGASSGELLAALRLVAQGGVSIPEVLVQHLLVDYLERSKSDSTRSYDGLTKREIEILKHIANGTSSREIAYLLSLSNRTVERFRASIMNKLGLRNQAELISYAIRRGFLSIDKVNK